jgi:hypothetical protein
MAESRLDLFQAIAGALRETHPDRHAGLLLTLERRLDPGPWSVDLDRSVPSAALNHDAVMAEVRRALEATDPDRAESRQRALERWIVDASHDAFDALLAQRELDFLSNTALVDWAVNALEIGVDAPSVRELAGLATASGGWELDRLLSRVRRDLGWPEQSRDEVLLRFFRSGAREILSGDREARAFLRAVYRLSNNRLPRAVQPWVDLANQSVHAEDLRGIVPEQGDIRADAFELARTFLRGAV